MLATGMVFREVDYTINEVLSKSRLKRKENHLR